MRGWPSRPSEDLQTGHNGDEGADDPGLSGGEPLPDVGDDLIPFEEAATRGGYHPPEHFSRRHAISPCEHAVKVVRVQMDDLARPARLILPAGLNPHQTSEPAHCTILIDIRSLDHLGKRALGRERFTETDSSPLDRWNLPLAIDALRARGVGDSHCLRFGTLVALTEPF